jgi:hypothetical protein
MKKYDKMVAEGPELDQFIFNIFGDQTKKKEASAKKKNIYQILKIKKQTFALPEPDDEEIPNEDAEVCDDADEV